MISIGIDASKDKHDCFIVISDGKVLANAFSISNNMDELHCLLQRIQECTSPQDKIKIRLVATGHYSYNLLRFLLDNGLATYVLTSLHTNLPKKPQPEKKTDWVDARMIASMLLSDESLKPYTSSTAYHNEELKSLTKNRFDKVKERTKLKSSVSRLVCILFPELKKLVPSLPIASLLEEYAGTHLTKLKILLETASKSRYNRAMAAEIYNAARNSINFRMLAKSLELQHTIRLIRELDAKITEIEKQIQTIMDELNSLITSIPGIELHMVAIILAEIGDFTRFGFPDKLLAYAGVSSSIYQLGHLRNCYPHMKKRSSRYLRYALYNATRYVCHWDSIFTAHLTKKQAENMHYNVAISHSAKKLVRRVFTVEKSETPYRLTARLLLLANRGLSGPLFCYTLFEPSFSPPLFFLELDF